MRLSFPSPRLLAVIGCAVSMLAGGSCIRPVAAQQTATLQARRQLAETLSAEARQERQQVADWTRQHNMPRVIQTPDGNRIELVRIEDGRPVYRTTHNHNAALTTRTTAVHPGQALDLELTGAGMVIGIWDGGHVYPGHQEFGPRVVLGDNGPLDGHSTHVGGTLAASGIRAEAQGMAYEATIHSYDWNADATEMVGAAETGLLISNHSYGTLAGWTYANLEGTGDQWYWLGDPGFGLTEDATFGFYDRESVRWDRIARTFPYYLPVTSVGNDRADTGPTSGAYRGYAASTGIWTNYTIEQRMILADGGLDGYDTIAGQALAKNALTVGSIGDLTLTTQTPRVSRFSSFGPTDDGRIKPDLVANGENLLSTALGGSGDRYQTLSGTSMSTPNVSGSLLLLQQFYHQRTGRFMRAATLKGLALHTTDDLGPAGPDYRFGWGLLNTETAARQILALDYSPLAVYEDSLALYETYSTFVITDGSGPVRITLSWTDPAGEAIRPRMIDEPILQLKNDLDLRLEDPITGVEYTPFVLDPLRPEAPAATGDNFVDPIEQIYVADLPPGQYTIRVTHKDTLLGEQRQPFSLITTGLVDRARVVAVTDVSTAVDFSGVSLQWHTAFENSAGTFFVERALLDPGNDQQTLTDTYDRIFSVPTHGTGTNPSTYTGFDSSAPPGTLRYRILFEPHEGEITAEADVTVFVPIAEVTTADGSSTLDAVTLDWTTAFERPHTGFRIERTGITFDALGNEVPAEPVVVGRLAPSGPMPAGEAYTFSDPYVPAGYYRYVLAASTETGDRFVLHTIDVDVFPPTEAALLSNYPNPFTDQTRILLDNPNRQHVTLLVYDVLGRRIDLVIDEELSAGRHEWTIDASSWPPGFYSLRLETNQQSATHQLVRVR